MTTRLLHLDSSILGGSSVSRTLSASIVAQLHRQHSRLQVSYRDLAATPIAHLSGAHLAASSAGETTHDPALQADLALGAAVLEEFLAADIVVLGVGFYNFGIPSQLKAWVDRLAIAGKTFRYTEKGPEGLAGGKRVILAIARGGYYGPGTPTAPLEHAELSARCLRVLRHSRNRGRRGGRAQRRRGRAQGEPCAGRREHRRAGVSERRAVDGVVAARLNASARPAAAAGHGPPSRVRRGSSRGQAR